MRTPTQQAWFERHRAVAAWRKQQTFATPELATLAENVERDLALLPQLGPHNHGTRANIMKNFEKFVEAFKSR